MTISNITSRTALAAGVVAAALLAGAQIAGAQAGGANSSVVGVWRVSEVTFTGPNARKITNPQPSVRIFTARHYSITQVDADSPRAELPIPESRTEKEIAAAFPAFLAGFTGQAGTYKSRATR